jgi:Fe-S cluster assembly iron-binding protein IscA
MLTITSDAADAIRHVVEAADLPGEGGMRISTASASLNGRGPALALELVESPDPEDLVLVEEDAKVYVDPIAASQVSDKTLDADYEPGGEVNFSMREQP